MLDALRNLFSRTQPPSAALPSSAHPVHHAAAFTIPVLVVSYFPIRGERIDPDVTGDVYTPLNTIREHTRRTTAEVVRALEGGSTYHGYRDSTALPCLRYQVVDSLEFIEPLPTWRKRGHRVPMTDYSAIMERIDIRHWVAERGVREVWLWGYHGGVIDLWESNMAGPFGDVSNSDRDPTDLPVLDQTYTVYHYNYGRGTSEAVEDHIHQIEAVLRHVNAHLFWDTFVGRPGAWRCGWAHRPPNATHDYDWANQRYVWSDIEDWHPDRMGQRQRINCTRWNCNSLGWFIYWMQNLPGADNGLSYRGRPLSNWWTFIGDYDAAMRAHLDLVAP